MTPKFSIVLLAGMLALSSPALRADPAIELPDIGDSSSRVLGEAESERIGKAAYRQIRAAGFVVDDPAANAYVQALGERIAAGTGWPLGSFKFFIVRADSINAFAMPGGYIGLHTGLIAAAESESELAGVVAHEITHVTQHHIARVLEATRPMNMATAALVIAAIVLGGGDAELTQAALSAGLASSIERQINFTRAHEHEADRVGIHLLAQAGFDPDGMARFFQHLVQKTRNYNDEFPEFLRTHPVTTTRIAEARARAARYQHVKVQESASFALVQQRLAVLSTPETQSPLRSYPKVPNDDAPEAIRYGYALALLEAGRLPEARKRFAALRDSNESNLYFHLGYLQAALAADDAEAVDSGFAVANLLFPGNQVVSVHHAQALLQLKRPREARRELSRALRNDPESPALHRLMARTAAELQLPVDAHLHMADFFVYNGERPRAQEQLEIALRQPELTEADRERLKARVRALRKGKDWAG